MTSAQRPQSDAVHRRRMTVALVVSGVLLAGAAIALGAASAHGGSGLGGPAAEATTSPPRPVPSTSAPAASVDPFNKHANSIDDPTSIWVVVDKLRPLNPKDYSPDDLVTVPVPHTWTPKLRQVASDAVVKMFDDAKSQQGLTLASNSAYRSYSSQQDVYHGDDQATARPGFSEHQTGLAIDIGAKSGHCSLAACFGETPEGVWLRDNAWKYGFILRYPADKTQVTGFEYEPWHFRYVGVDLATRMHDTGITTLEEFFGLPAAPNYQ